MATSPPASIYRRLLGHEDASPFSDSALRKLPYAAVAVPLLIVHLALSQLGWILISGGPLTPVWPAAGLDLVVLLVFGTRFWPVLLAAYFITDSGRSLAWAPALGMAYGILRRSLRLREPRYCLRWLRQVSELPSCSSPGAFQPPSGVWCSAAGGSEMR